MKKRLVFFLYYIVFWLSFFIVTRLLFLLVYHNLSFNLGINEWFYIFGHGMKMDFSAIGYILLLPGLATVMTSYFNGDVMKKVINIYTAIILGITSFIVIVDLELYKYWGFRLDSSPLLYINTPKDMMASVPVWVYIRQILIGAVIYCIFYYFYKKWIFNRLENLEAGKWQAAGLFLFLTAALIIPIRGGFGIAPMNVGTAYFSENLFENHASINVVWNLGYSLANLNDVDKSYDYLKTDEANNLFHGLDQVKEDKTQKVFNQEKPNIVLVIVESFTSKLIEPLGGRQGVTPQFNQLLKEGILFDHMYASGDRSDKGIVALLSGFPALPNSSIIKFAQKTQHLPFLTKDLKKIGYNTAFYYGGDVDFANLRSYLTLAGFDKIVCKDSFPPSTYNAKWGVHDHIVFDKLFNDISHSKGPFFKTYFTLSNHDPFDVPMKTVFAGKDDDNKFLNSAYYTDQCIGNFVRRAKKAPWWKNTVIIFVADHGSPRPGNTPVYAEEKFRIPMLWLGGALIPQHEVISKYGSQTDFAFTILKQLGQNDAAFHYSKNMLSDQSKGYAFYAFNNGFGFMTDTSKVVFDHTGKKILTEKGKSTNNTLKTGKAYMQQLYTDFTNK